ncbi:MAG: sugar ABC transporter permease [Anaerolineae bacterium]|nr:sugar ABC transporter permease [Anaerolineae bacterium]
MQAEKTIPIMPQRSITDRLVSWLDEASPSVLLMPAVLIVLVLAVFPLIVSLYLSFSRFQFVRGGFDITFIGFKNYEKLLFGSEQRYVLGKLSQLDPVGWLVFAIYMGIMLYLLYRYATSPRMRVFGFIMRVLTVAIAGTIGWIALRALTGNGLPGNLIVTLIFVLCGVTLQYLIGLGLGMLLTQNLPGKRFFRVAFLLPMMITPVGIAFLFRMLISVTQGPLGPLFKLLGTTDFSWVDTPHGARLIVVMGDTWQWTPFMFIILLAALEGVSRETIEAALVDGANRLQLFRFIILPEVIPVSITVILIRMIEAFKLIDIPNVMMGGGPGTATETMTLYSYKAWKGLDLGLSSAVSYLLLFVVTFAAMVFVNIIRRRVLEITQ